MHDVDASGQFRHYPHMPLLLLVEDNETHRDMLTRRLEGKGFRVQEAADGQQGALLAATIIPDLIIMDMDLPILDGHEASLRIKATPRLDTIPIIGLSEPDMASGRGQDPHTACNEYLAKPVDFARLLASIERLLNIGPGK